MQDDRVRDRHGIRGSLLTRPVDDLRIHNDVVDTGCRTDARAGSGLDWDGLLAPCRSTPPKLPCQTSSLLKHHRTTKSTTVQQRRRVSCIVSLGQAMVPCPGQFLHRGIATEILVATSGLSVTRMSIASVGAYLWGKPRPCEGLAAWLFQDLPLASVPCDDEYHADFTTPRGIVTTCKDDRGVLW